MRTMLATLGGLIVLSACTANTSAAGDAIAVNSGDDVCEVAASEAPSGTVQFTVKNTGSQVTEFYVLADDGLQILSEVENIGPGLARDLVDRNRMPRRESGSPAADGRRQHRDPWPGGPVLRASPIG